MRFSPLRALTSLIVLAAAAVPAAAQAGGAATPPPYVAADAQFMTGMIGHHAQAVLIAGWAPSHGASPSIVLLTRADRRGPAGRDRPHDRGGCGPGRAGARPEALTACRAWTTPRSMPGMLSAEQLAALDAARGPEFDRLFLTYMIQHHSGAIVMVDQLFATHGRRAGRGHLPLRLRHLRRPDDRDPPDAEDAGRPAPERHQPLKTARPRPFAPVQPPLTGMIHGHRTPRSTSGQPIHRRPRPPRRSRSGRSSVAGCASSSASAAMPAAPAAEPRPARRPQGRPVGRRRGHVEPARRLDDPALGAVRRRHQLRPLVHRELRHPGQLQRLPGLGHLQPGQALAEGRASSAPPRRATSRCTGTCSSCRARATPAALDCGTQGVQDTVSADRLRGIRIFDITDIANPKYIANVQTCRGSHTHTVVVDPKDKDNVYIYVSGSAGVRSPNELPGCSGWRRTRTRTRRCSGSRSSRCRWRTRSRRRS